jgi:hypothetical protein
MSSIIYHCRQSHFVWIEEAIDDYLLQHREEALFIGKMAGRKKHKDTTTHSHTVSHSLTHRIIIPPLREGGVTMTQT